MRGIVKDQITGETLPGANIYLSDKTGVITPEHIGTTSNHNGHYNLNNPVTDGFITASFSGYQKQTKPVGEVVDFELSGQSLEGVEIIDKRPGFFSKHKYEVIAGLASIVLIIIILKLKEII